MLSLNDAVGSVRPYWNCRHPATFALLIGEINLWHWIQVLDALVKNRL